MFQRTVKLPKSHSFFLFGARGTGKSTLLKNIFPQAHIFDLLDAKLEEEFFLDPQAFETQVLALPQNISHIVVDEIQKNPKLLDAVHRLIERKDRERYFLLTGSSARKLKAGGANLLAGRAFVRNLYPLSFTELGNAFSLAEVISFGSLPKIFSLKNDDEKRDFLESYSHTYLKEEIWGEQIIRNLPPFRKFLEIAATGFGKIIVAANIAKDVGVDPKTVQSYFQILEDTLLGFHLEPYHLSVRKRQRQGQKFYFFDNGVTRGLSRMLSVFPKESTSYYGDLFEQFIINEIYRRNSYEKLDYKFSYLQSASGVEVDLVIERPGKPLALVEIKSSTRITEQHASSLMNYKKDFPEADLFLLSRDENSKKFDNILSLPWQQGVLKL